MDPSMYPAIISGAAGITGALLGATSAYHFNKRLEKRKIKTANVRLALLFAYDLSGQVDALALEIDRLLPYWVHREEEILKKVYTNIKPAQLETDVFDAYRNEVLHLPSAMQILFCYNLIASVNRQASSGTIAGYANTCQRALLATMGTLEQILNAPKVGRTMRLEKCEHIYERYNTMNKWYNSRLELASLTYSKRVDLETKSTQNPDLLKKYNGEWGSLLAAAREVRKK